MLKVILKIIIVILKLFIYNSWQQVVRFLRNEHENNHDKIIYNSWQRNLKNNKIKNI